MKTTFYYNPSICSFIKGFSNVNDGYPNEGNYYLMGRRKDGGWIYLDDEGYIEEATGLDEMYNNAVANGVWREITLKEFFKQF